MTIGLVSGSFDPITRGHTAFIKKAVSMVDFLYVAIARNGIKGKCYFDDHTKLSLVCAALQEELNFQEMDRIKVIYVEEGMIVDQCDAVDATIIFRGLRDAADFAYEQKMEQYNADFAPHISTVFLMTPPNMAKISSSAIKSIVGLKHWEVRIAQFVHPATLLAFKRVVNFNAQGYTRVVA